MYLKKLLTRRSALSMPNHAGRNPTDTGGAGLTANANSAGQATTAPGHRALENVVTFPLRADWYESRLTQQPHVSEEPMTPDELRFRGLLTSPEIAAFFAENYFAYGRHNGANYRNHEALQQGRQERISRFQNIVEGMIGRRQTKIHKIKSELLAIEGISPLTTSQLNLAAEHLEGEIVSLREQIQLAYSGQGWVREALVRYETGFAKGMREALDFDMLVV